jgi:hypothetical protein
MSHRNLPPVPQHYNGNHHSGCGCMQGHHIWDLEFDKEAKHERYCVCCDHFFLSEDAEDNAADNAIEMPGKINKSEPKSPISAGGLNKGKIRRRS